MLRRPARVQRPSGEAAHRIVVVAAVIGLGDRLGGRHRLPWRALRRAYVGPAVLGGRLGRGGRRGQLGGRARDRRREWRVGLPRIQQVGLRQDVADAVQQLGSRLSLLGRAVRLHHRRHAHPVQRSPGRPSARLGRV